MKCVSLTQPWASLVAIGAKKIETRSWRTEHRGPVAIHAAKAFPRNAIELCFEQPFGRVLFAAGIKTPADLPRGMVIATVTLRRVERVESIRDLISDQEDAFGNYDDGRYAWVFENPILLPEPVPVRGALGLWNWRPAELRTAVASRE